MCRTVFELLELHRELDVGQRAAAELEVEAGVFAGRDALALDARLHATDLAPPGLGERIAVHVLPGAFEERATELGVAGDERARVSAWNSHTSARSRQYVS